MPWLILFSIIRLPTVLARESPSGITYGQIIPNHSHTHARNHSQQLLSFVVFSLDPWLSAKGIIKSKHGEYSYVYSVHYNPALTAQSHCSEGVLRFKKKTYFQWNLCRKSVGWSKIEKYESQSFSDFFRSVCLQLNYTEFSFSCAFSVERVGCVPGGLIHLVFRHQEIECKNILFWQNCGNYYCGLQMPNIVFDFKFFSGLFF